MVRFPHPGWQPGLACPLNIVYDTLTGILNIIYVLKATQLIRAYRNNPINRIRRTWVETGGSGACVSRGL